MLLGVILGLLGGGIATFAIQKVMLKSKSEKLIKDAQIEAEKSKAVNELRLDVSKLAIDLASKIVGASLQDDARAKAVIDQFIKDLESAGCKR